MAQEKPSRIGDWIVALRKHAPVLTGQLAEWFAEARKEPRLFWENAAIRYIVYVSVGFILFAGVKCGANAISAPQPETAVPQARTADYHVFCSDPKCGHHFVINRKFEFARFPVECPKCKKKTGMEAVKCYSQECRGRWSFKAADNPLRCAKCGEKIK